MVPAIVPGTHSKKDHVLAVARVGMDDEEQVGITVHFLSSSAIKFRGKPAVSAETKMKIQAVLPSIMQADTELHREYFDNLIKSLVLEHHTSTGKNALHLRPGK